MRDWGRQMNKIIGFNFGELNDSEREIVGQISKYDLALKREAESDWYTVHNEINELEKLANRIGKNSEKPEHAEGIIDTKIRVYQSFLQLIDHTRKAVNATPSGKDEIISSSEFSEIHSKITALRTQIQEKINTSKEVKNSILVGDTPENAKEKFLKELSDKKLALDALADTIAKTEIAIKQDERNITVTPDGLVKSDALQKEVLDKQSSIADQKDDLANKKDELEKLLSGKNPALENLKNTLRDQRSERQKLTTKEESYEIRAPFSGIIRSIKIKTGDIMGSDSANQKWILLENSDIINIKVALNQLDIIKVKLGQKADIAFEALPGVDIEGKITEISSTPKE